MRAKIQKWGNSLGLRLPKAVTLEAHLAEGDDVDIVTNGSDVVIRPLGTKRYKLAELLRTYPKSSEAAESDWGRSIGPEAW
jgi:antitoxin MazE